MKSSPNPDLARAESVQGLRLKLAAAKTVLADREAELLNLKGPCSNGSCRLHYAHSGPCDNRSGGRGRER